MWVLKRSRLLLLAVLLTGCLAVELDSHDFSGRQVVTATQAADLFIQNCYNSPDGSVVNNNASFTYLPGKETDRVAAVHNSVSAFFQSHTDKVCRMSYFGPKVKIQSLADTAAVLAESLNADLVSSKRGKPLSMTTPKGKIDFGGNLFVLTGTPPIRHPQRYSIWFTQK